MKTWDELITEFQDTKSANASRLSENNSLVNILTKAKKLGIDPSITEGASHSNLREIIREAKFAIKKSDKAYLEELFIKAATYKTVDLRIALGKSRPVCIKVEVIYEDNEPIYNLRLNEEQYERIVSSTKAYFQFE